MSVPKEDLEMEMMDIQCLNFISCGAPHESAAGEMDVTSAESKSVMASSGTVGSVTVSLHPLVIMNVSEHWTRVRAQEGCAQQGLQFKILRSLYLNQ